MTGQALLPLKDLVQAKSRLAGLLRPSERRALAQAMAEDVLCVLAGHADIARITLVSDDPGAPLLARQYGADCWAEQSLACRGLNALMQRASERLLRRDGDTLVVLHADLPLLRAGDISAVLDAQRQSAGLIIGCDTRGEGTNLLAFDAASRPRFSFGADSCARHLAAAREAKVPARILRRSGIAMDVDEPGDLRCAMERLCSHPTGNTARLLRGTALGDRLALALTVLPGVNDAFDGDNRGSG